MKHQPSIERMHERLEVSKSHEMCAVAVCHEPLQKAALTSSPPMKPLWHHELASTEMDLKLTFTYAPVLLHVQSQTQAKSLHFFEFLIGKTY